MSGHVANVSREVRIGFRVFPKTGFAQSSTLQLALTIQPNGKVTNSYNQHDVRGGGRIIPGLLMNI